MTSFPRVPLRQRSTGDPVSFSSLAIAPRTFGPASPEAIAQSARLLRTCWDQGVRTFDLAASGSVQVALACLSAAFPTPPDGMTLVVPLEEPPDPAARSGARSRPSPAVAAPSVARVPADRASWGEGIPKVVELPWKGPSHPTSQRSDFDLVRARRIPGFLDWVRPYRSGEARSDDRGSEGLLSGEFSLLERGPAGDPALSAIFGSCRFLARNVLATGRLDGSAWTALEGPSTGSASPRPVRDLESTYRPILDLEFLTRSRERTLAQAALAYVLAHPWVLTASVLLPAPHRLGEILSFATTPTLSPDELARLDVPKAAFS